MESTSKAGFRGPTKPITAVDAFLCLLFAVLFATGRTEENQVNAPGLTPADGAEAVELPWYENVMKIMKIIEDKRQGATPGEFYSTQSEEYENCDINCQNGSNLQGSCGLDCRDRYQDLKIEELRNIISNLQKQATFLKTELHNSRSQQSSNKSIIFILFGISVMILVAATSGVLVYVRTLDRRRMEETKSMVEKQKMHAFPAGDNANPPVEPREEDILIEERNVPEQRENRAYLA